MRLSQACLMKGGYKQTQMRKHLKMERGRASLLVSLREDENSRTFKMQILKPKTVKARNGFLAGTIRVHFA